MPLIPVGFHPEAIAEAAATVGWYRERSDAAAAAFLAELDRAVENIAEAPERWPQYLHGTRRFLLHRFPFAVVYRWVGGGVQVVAVAHARRRPGYWKGR
jgi:plasmid stabilization system protein ParE